ncbi:hypothetical protein [Micromonospora endolithica]|uniref:hypothetical protein n=1 Tax=Micromonospora endolithica TaxID=230091 RepID=UPI0011ABA2C2|nr:hypothetical protein [Micromonospora endolithica]TWJ24019.1 hypothetical protein JD76_04165 [Micromonospora endolithica]
MRDDLPIAELVHRDLRDVRWAEPAEIRARARRRRRRTVVSAGLALVLVTTGGYGVWRVDRPAPAPPVAAHPTGSPFVEIPHETMLRPADLGVPADPPLSQAGAYEPVRIAELLRVCVEQQGRPAEWETARYSRSVTLLRERPAGYDHPPSDLLLSQDVYRVTPEVVGRLFPRIDEMLALCAAWPSRGVAVWKGREARSEAVHHWDTSARDFAGSESVLLRHRVPEARNLETGEVRRSTDVNRTAVVRVGDLVTVITMGRRGTEPELRRLAGVAADRLCVAANPAC